VPVVLLLRLERKGGLRLLWLEELVHKLG
jgi:hypothetical protein